MTTKILAGVRGVVWLLCIGWTALSFILGMVTISKAQSAIQEASGAAMLCASLITTYVIARAVDKVVLVIEVLITKPK